MAKRPTRDHEQTAHDVLARRLEVSAGELLELVHAINPTGRVANKADEHRRYELKSRLQSLLIERFADALELTEQAGGIVALRHKYVGRDACHARLDELSLEARSIVRKQLDAGSGPDEDAPATSRSDASSSTPAGPLEQGRRALAEFDYETARTCFERASDDGDLAATRALLELLVDHLALDDDALAAGARITTAHVTDGEVRALLGLAAARAGRWSEATTYLRDLHVARAADGRALKARDVLARGAWDELAVELRELERCDPAHPELHALRDDAARAREAARRPAEQDLLELVERDAAAAEHAARTLLERWPDSAIAGRVLGRIHGDRRRAEGERLRDLAIAALADAQPARAEELACLAAEMGVDVEVVLEDARAAARAHRSEREATVVRLVCDRLASDATAGLHAYADLEPELRRRVREGDTRSELRWLDVVLEHARKAQLRDAVESVVALARAHVVPDTEAVALIAPYEELLAPVPAARALRAALQRRAAERRRAVAAGALAGATEALRVNDFARCEQLCVAIDPRDLDPEHRTRREQLLETSRGVRAIDRARRSAEELASAGGLLSARRELVAVLSHPMLDEERASAVRDRLTRLEGEVRRAWFVQSVPCLQSLDRDPIGELLGRLPHEEHVLHLLTPERDLVIVGAHGRDIHIMWISVQRRSVVRRAYLHAPEPLGELTATCIDGDTLWIADSRFLLQLDLASCEPRRWESLERFAERLERVFVLPGASHMWIDAFDAKRSIPYRIVNLDRWQVVREVPSARSIHPVVGGGKLAMLGVPFHGGAVLQSERGSVLEALPACDGLRVCFGAFDPSGDLVVAVGGIDDDDAVVCLRGIAAGRTAYDHMLPDSHPDLRISGATAVDARMMFVSYATTTGGEGTFVGLRFGARALEPAWSVPTSSTVLFVQDAKAREVVCLWEGPSGIELDVLGDAPPQMAQSSTTTLPSSSGYFACCPYDESPVTRADRSARDGDWMAVRNQLEPLAPDTLSAPAAAHRCHLLGLALLRTGGSSAAARALWTRGAELDEEEDRHLDCGFGALLQLIDDPITDSPPHQLRRAVRSADEHLDTDPRAALEAIRRRVVTRDQEAQSLARLAAAWLGIAASDEERFDKAIALSRYLDGRPEHGLPIPEAWPAERLNALSQRARDWLDRWRADLDTR